MKLKQKKAVKKALTQLAVGNPKEATSTLATVLRGDLKIGERATLCKAREYIESKNVKDAKDLLGILFL